jgi:hypothetical protein
MTDAIELNTVGKGLHFGSKAGYERFANSYFEKVNQNFIDKIIIYSIFYKPNEIYITTDGYGGTCWHAEMIEHDNVDTEWATGFAKYRFRNFEDLIEYYKEKGFVFVNCLELNK